MSNGLLRNFPMNFPEIQRIDFIEFFCRDAVESSRFFRTFYSFREIACNRTSSDRFSILCEQGKNIRFLFTSPKIGSANGPVDSFLETHGDGVRTVALTCRDCLSAYSASTRLGATPFMSPEILKDENGEVVISGVHAYGDVVHLFVEREAYDGIFLPGYEPIKNIGNQLAIFTEIDHVVGNVGWFEMVKWSDFYTRVFGMVELVSFENMEISTEYSSLNSKVLVSRNGSIKFPINEPAKGKMKSQIEDFLENNGGPGIQHIALATDDIIMTVNELKRRGVSFLETPEEYYHNIVDRVGPIDERINDLSSLGILVDREKSSSEGYLLQIFTKPVTNRQTFFMEIIQRKGGSVSFGRGNFQSLFKSMEREQERRGALRSR